MLSRKKKPCANCGEERFIYARKMCQVCYWSTRSKKASQKPQKPMKRTLLKSKRKPTGELDLFKAIWAVRPHRSQLSKHPIQFSPSCFAHLLNKKNYPELRLKPENIWLLTPEEHTLLDHGTEAEREKYALKNNCSWEPLYEAKNAIRSKLDVK